MKPEYRESPYPGDRIDKELWTSLRETIFEDGHLCYHDDEGCHYVLREIIEILKKYQIKKKKECINIDKSAIKTEMYICEDGYPLTNLVLIDVCKVLFQLANEAGLDGIKFHNLKFAERPTGPLNQSSYKLFKWEVDA
jgi:hypothetical protein